MARRRAVSLDDINNITNMLNELQVTIQDEISGTLLNGMQDKASCQYSNNNSGGGVSATAEHIKAQRSIPIEGRIPKPRKEIDNRHIRNLLIAEQIPNEKGNHDVQFEAINNTALTVIHDLFNANPQQAQATWRHITVDQRNNMAMEALALLLAEHDAPNFLQHYVHNWAHLTSIQWKWTQMSSNQRRK